MFPDKFGRASFARLLSNEPEFPHCMLVCRHHEPLSLTLVTYSLQLKVSMSMFLLVELPAWSGTYHLAAAFELFLSQKTTLPLMEINQQQEQRPLLVLLVSYAMHLPVNTACLTELQKKGGLQSPVSDILKSYYNPSTAEVSWYTLRAFRVRLWCYDPKHKCRRIQKGAMKEAQMSPKSW